MNYQEENNYPKAFLVTGIILAVMAALCYLIIIGFVPQIDGTGGILVNYGTTNAGMGSDINSVEDPSVSLKANHTQPTKVTQAPTTEQKSHVDASNEKIVTQNNEDAPEVASNSKKASHAAATTAAKPVHKRVVNQNALYHGPSKTGSGNGDGTTTTPGNQGSRNGSILSDNYGPGGSGNGLNMPNWNTADPPDVKDIHNVPGVVVVDFTVDQNGRVIEAHFNRRKTKAELNMIQSAVDAIKDTRFTSSTPVSGTSNGEYTFVFKVR